MLDYREYGEYKWNKERLDKLHPDLFDNMELFLQLPHDTARKVVMELLYGLAAANELSIMFSAFWLWKIPTDWFSCHLRDIVETVKPSVFDINDDYDYCRLLDTFGYQPELLKLVVAIGLEQSNPEVVAFAKEHEGVDCYMGFYEATMKHMGYIGVISPKNI